MKTNYEVRYAAHPRDAKGYDTARLREDFPIKNISLKIVFIAIIG